MDEISAKGCDRQFGKKVLQSHRVHRRQEFNTSEIHTGVMNEDKREQASDAIVYAPGDHDLRVVHSVIGQPLLTIEILEAQ